MLLHVRSTLIVALYYTRTKLDHATRTSFIPMSTTVIQATPTKWVAWARVKLDFLNVCIRSFPRVIMWRTKVPP